MLFEEVNNVVIFVLRGMGDIKLLKVFYLLKVYLGFLFFF